MIFQQEDIIHSYSRSSALDDGFQVCVSDQFPSDTRIFQYPVYFTHEVWKLCQGKGVIVWDLCYLAALASKSQSSNTSTIQFSVIVQGSQISPDFFEDGLPCYQLLAQCGATDIDDPNPAITIMFVREQ